MCTAISAWYWLRDPRTTIVPLTESLFIHPIFTVATLTLSKITEKFFFFFFSTGRPCTRFRFLFENVKFKLIEAVRIEFLRLSGSQS